MRSPTQIITCISKTVILYEILPSQLHLWLLYPQTYRIPGNFQGFQFLQIDDLYHFMGVIFADVYCLWEIRMDVWHTRTSLYIVHVVDIKGIVSCYMYNKFKFAKAGHRIFKCIQSCVFESSAYIGIDVLVVILQLVPYTVYLPCSLSFSVSG